MKYLGKFDDRKSIATKEMLQDFIEFSESDMVARFEQLEMDLKKFPKSSELTAIRYEINAIKSSLGTKLKVGLVPPTSFRVDRSGEVWTIWFDNGSGLQFPNTPKNLVKYGIGYVVSTTSSIPVNIPKSFLQQAMWGNLNYLTVFNNRNNVFTYWTDDVLVLNPVNDRNDYDFSDAYVNRNDTNATSKENQRNAIRVLWELGIWTDEELSYFGAVRKK